MRIAVVGSGISGMASAWLLGREHEVVLFEASDYVGGHTHTHDVEAGNQRFAVDSGFIVFNPENYPLLSRMFNELGVESQPTTMSFAVRDERSNLEYGATNLNSLFCQRRNLFSPRFIGMVRDIVRFYREAPAVLTLPGEGPTVGEYLAANGYGALFRDDHLLPMTSALWSSPATKALEFPLKYLVTFMTNHHMMQVDGRPAWRVVKGGSQRYVDKLKAAWNVQVRLNTPVRKVQRVDGKVDVDGERFDHAVLACHSDQALAMLAEPTAGERDVLGAIGYQHNDTVLHNDIRVLPRNRNAWSAWNVLVPTDAGAPCTVTYCMNLLQSLQAPETFCVSLNCGDRIDPARVIRRMRYAHPAYTHGSVAAQQRKKTIQGNAGIWFAGAYWGWGFHEDGMRSALDVVNGLGTTW